MKDKICRVITKIWGIAVFVLLFGGGLTVLGYLAAFILGGNTGEAIAVFIYKQYFPIFIWGTSILIILGWIKMEVDGEKALTASTEKNKDSKKK